MKTRSQVKKEVRTPLYRIRVVSSKKGRGSYQRVKIKFQSLDKGE